MGAWCTDYLAYWAGHDGIVRHTKADFRGPAFEGDVTYFDAEVVDKQPDTAWGVPLVQVKLRLTNQNGETLGDLYRRGGSCRSSDGSRSAPIAFARIRPAAERRAGAGCTDAARFSCARSTLAYADREALAFPTPDGGAALDVRRNCGNAPSRWRRHCARAG